MAKRRKAPRAARAESHAAWRIHFSQRHTADDRSRAVPAREKDPQILRQAAKLLVCENERFTDKVVALTSENLALKGANPADLQLRLAQLEAQLAVKNKLLFGKSSEKRPLEKAETSPEKKPQVGHGPREQPALPVVEKFFALDDADLGCPKCGKTLAAFAGQFEESEEITVVERRFVVVKQKRQKYRCECNGCIETAPGPVKLFPGARYSVDFAVEVATGKYLDHQPLERQVRTMAREGLVVDSQTLWDQVERLARILGSAKEAPHLYVLAHAVIGADETRWRLLDGKGKDAGEAKQWQVWAVAAPDAVAYSIEDSRSAEAAKKALRDFKGAVMADGYGVYESLAKAPGSFILANCWAHVRRKYLDVEHAFPAQVKEVIDLIGELYAVDRLCPTGPPGDDLRRRLRDEAFATGDGADQGVGDHGEDADPAGERDREGHRLHARHVARPRALPRRPAHPARQQRHRARAARRGGRQGELLTELLDRFRKMPDRDSVTMGALVRDMVLRKHTLYPEDLRLVGEWELRDLGDGEVSLRAVAHAPPKK